MIGLNAYLTQICLLQQSSIEGSDAVPYFWYSQDTMPYWVNRIGAVDPQLLATDENEQVYHITMRLVIAHLVQGYDGEPELLLGQYIDDVLTYFASRPRLMLNAEDSFTADDLLEAGITLTRGYTIFTNSAALQIGCEFTLELRISRYYEDLNN
jgi:hypothetical protein